MLVHAALGICHSPQAVKGIDVSLKGVRDMETLEEIKRIVEMVYFFEVIWPSTLNCFPCADHFSSS